MNRLQLLEILKANLDKHIKSYLESVDVYNRAIRAELEGKLKELGSITDNVVTSTVKLESIAPSSFENSYKDIIQMLELSVDENITLDSGAFKQYIKDEWNWKSAFLAGALANAHVTSKYIG